MFIFVVLIIVLMGVGEESGSLVKFIPKKYQPYVAGFILLCALFLAAWEIFKPKESTTDNHSVNDSHNTINVYPPVSKDTVTLIPTKIEKKEYLPIKKHLTESVNKKRESVNNVDTSHTTTTIIQNGPVITNYTSTGDGIGIQINNAPPPKEAPKGFTNRAAGIVLPINGHATLTNTHISNHPIGIEYDPYLYKKDTTKK